MQKYKVTAGAAPAKTVEAHNPSHAADRVVGSRHSTEPRPLAGGRWEARLKRNRSVIVTIEEVN